MSWHHGLDSGGCDVDHDVPEPEETAAARPISLRTTPDQRRLLALARDRGGVTKAELHSWDWRRLDALADRGLLRRTMDRRNTHVVTQAGIDSLGVSS